MQNQREMRLPKKITPDRIRDSIVQVFFTSDIPFDPLIGYLYSYLQEKGYSYTNRPIPPKSDLSVTNVQATNVFEVNLLPQHLFFNEDVKILLNQNGSIIFNCLNEYIGWERYEAVIKEVLGFLYEKEVLSGFTRIGIRYISEFPNISIEDHLNVSLNIEKLDATLQSRNFRTEWLHGQDKLIIQFASKLPINAIVTDSGMDVEFVSLIDVDVIRENLAIYDMDSLMKNINEAHKLQKSSFFCMLKEEFLQTLNPEY